MTEQLKDKVIVFTEAPPPEIWEAISTRLEDDVRYGQVATALQKFEIAPPPEAWKQIDQRRKMFGHNKRPVITKRLLAQWAVAASLLLCITATYWIVLKGHSKGALNADFVGAAGQEEKELMSSTHSLPNAFGDSNAPAPRYATIDDFSFYHGAPFSNVYVPDAGGTIRQLDQRMLQQKTGYLLVYAPGGQLTRLSAKFAAALGYFDADDNSDEYLDKVIEQSGIWKQQFENWRDKIRQSGYIPSSGNFLDILELKDLVQDK